MLSHSSFRLLACALAGFAAATVSATAIQAGGSVVAPVPDEGYLLRYTYHPNDLVYYEVTHHSQVTVKGEGLKEVTTNETKARKHYRVISVDDEGAGLLELVIDHAAMRVQFGDAEPVEFDSNSNQPPPPQFRRVKELIGKPRVRTRLTANGELKKVIVLNRMSARPVGQLAAAPPTEADDPSHNFLLVLPEEPVRVGEGWSERIVVQVRINKSLLRPVTLLRKFTLKSVEDNLATIEMNSVILTPIRDPSIRTQLIQRTPKCVAIFDLDRGLIVSKTTTVNERQVGGITDKSSMHVISRRTERLITPTETAATSAPARN